MIDFVRAYYASGKSLFENFVIKSDLFFPVHKKIDIRTKKVIYPITTEKTGLSVKIGRYKGYINGFPKILYNDLSKRKLSAYENLCYSKLVKSLRYFEMHMVFGKYAKISSISIAINIPTDIPGREIIIRNILMHKYKAYNHDIKTSVNRELKEFVYTNYTIGFYSKKQLDKNENGILKIKMKFCKSKGLRLLGIYTCTDLYDKEKLKGLFLLLNGKFDEFTIVDNIIDYSQFSCRDKDKMSEFMNVDYWGNLRLKYSKQTLLVKKRQFEFLQQKYNLNTLKMELKRTLKRTIRDMMNN